MFAHPNAATCLVPELIYLHMIVIESMISRHVIEPGAQVITHRSVTSQFLSIFLSSSHNLTKPQQAVSVKNFL